MNHGSARTLLAAAILTGFTAVAAVAEDRSTGYDDFFDSNYSSAATFELEAELATLRQQLDTLSVLYDDLHQQIQTGREIHAGAEMISLKERLDAPLVAFESGYTSTVPGRLTGSCCDTGCDECCDRCGVYAGFALVWIKPHFQENTAFVVDPPPNDNIVTPFDYDYDLTPRIWLGYTSSNGLGVRARYWEYDHVADSRSYAPNADNPLVFVGVSGSGGAISRNAFAGVGETMTASHSLELRTVDIEATKSGNWNCASVMAGLGIRYAMMDQRFRAAALAGDVIDELVDHRHRFEGAGPTASLFVTHPFGGSGNCGVYGGIRGSVLFGDVDQNILEIKGAGTTVGRDSYSGDETMAIGELELGLQYSRMLESGTLVFLRGGYEGQLWFDAGGPLGTTGDMGLEGIVLGLGVER